MTGKFLPLLYQTIAQEAVFGIVVFDEKSQFLFSNTTANFTLNSEEPKLSEMIPAEGSLNLKGFSSELLQNEGFYQDILIAKSGGGSFIANVGIRLIKLDNFTATLIMFQDITIQKKLQRDIIAKQNEIKSAYEEMVRQNTALKQLDVAKDRFIALTTHELRTPLAAMVASAEILKMGIYDNETQMKEFIDIIYDQGLHLQDLVNDILDFAKIQAGKMDIYLEKKDPNLLIQSILRNFEGMAETNQVSLHLHAPDAEPLCYFDEVRLRQVLSNIISNAIKYNRPNGRVEVSIQDIGERIKIAIKDTGKGIPKDQFDKVFNEFETVGQVENHHKGTGLGMPISRKLTEGMGGTLNFDSEVGLGSTFYVELTKEKVLAEEMYRPRSANLLDVA